MRSTPVSLQYDLATASNDGQHSDAGFDGKGNALPAEMLPDSITFNDVQFKLAPAKTGTPNAVIAKGQTINLPAGRFNRVYLLAASADGDQKASFEAGGKPVDSTSRTGADSSVSGTIASGTGRISMSITPTTAR